MKDEDCCHQPTDYVTEVHFQIRTDFWWLQKEIKDVIDALILIGHDFYPLFLLIKFQLSFKTSQLLSTREMPVLPSYRNQSINLLCKSIDWFLSEGTLAFNGLIFQNISKETWCTRSTFHSDLTTVSGDTKTFVQDGSGYATCSSLQN